MKSGKALRAALLVLGICAASAPSLAAVNAVPTASLHRAMSQGDDNLDPNWDWVTNRPVDLYVKHGTGVVHHPGIPLPYYSNDGPASKLFNYPGEEDIKREDGWVLVYRDFGRPDAGTTLPILVLYNRYRGILRYFYFNTNDEDNYTYALHRLSQPRAGTEAAAFTFDEKMAFLDGANYDRKISLVSIGEIGYLQWSYADFPVVGFDPNLVRNATLRFEIFGVDESTLKIDGTVSLHQVLEDGNVSAVEKDGKFDLIGGIKALKGFYDKGKGAYDTGKKWHNQVVSFKDNLRKEMNKDPKAPYWEPVRDILNSAIGTFAPGIAKVAGIISSFIGGGRDSHAQVAPVVFVPNLEGELHLTGVIKTERFVYGINIRMPASPEQVGDDRAKPLYNEPLGIFNLVAKPVVKYRFNYTCYFACGLPGGGVGIYHSTAVGLTEPLRVVLNPTLAKDIIRTTGTTPGASVVAEVGNVLPTQVITNYAPGSTAPVEFIIPPKGSEQGPLQWDKFGRPNIALKITLTPNSRTAVIAKLSFAQAIARAPIIIAPPVMEPAIIMKTYTPDFVPWQ